MALKCPTEVAITDRREKELADQGLVPLVHCKGTDYAAFFSVQTANKPKLYDKEAANANARLSAQLPYMLAMSRFAHYLKAMMRDKIGSFMSRQDCEKFLNQWIMNYVCADDNASQAAKAKLPLARSVNPGFGNPREAWRIPRSRIFEAAFPTRRTVCFASSGGRSACIGAEITGRHSSRRKHSRQNDEQNVCRLKGAKNGG